MLGMLASVLFNLGECCRAKKENEWKKARESGRKTERGRTKCPQQT